MAAAAEFDWSALVRPAWRGRTLLVRGYVTLRADRTGFATNPKPLDLGDARVVFFAGHIKYLKTAGKLLVHVRPKLPIDQTQPDPVINLTQPPGMWERTNPGFYTLIGTPGSPNNPSEPLARIEEAVGLLITFESTRYVLDQLFEIEVTPGPPDQLSAWSHAFHVPPEVKEADLSDQRLTTLASARSAIDALDAKKKNRVLLSLRWFENATTRITSASGVDAFIAYWIALEALAMPATTSPQALDEGLAAIYGGTPEAAKRRFLTRKLHKLRGGIVHGGKRVAVTPDIQRYVESLYVDVLFHELGVPVEHRAASVLASSNVATDLKALVK